MSRITALVNSQSNPQIRARVLREQGELVLWIEALHDDPDPFVKKKMRRLIQRAFAAKRGALSASMRARAMTITDKRLLQTLVRDLWQYGEDHELLASALAVLAKSNLAFSLYASAATPARQLALLPQLLQSVGTDPQTLARLAINDAVLNRIIKNTPAAMSPEQARAALITFITRTQGLCQQVRRWIDAGPEHISMGQIADFNHAYARAFSTVNEGHFQAVDEPTRQSVRTAANLLHRAKHVLDHLPALMRALNQYKGMDKASEQRQALRQSFMPFWPEVQDGGAQ